LAGLVAIVFIAATARAQQGAKKDEGPSSWLPILRQQAADYDIVAKGESTSRPKPLADPILRWTQPVRGGDDGAVFLWVADGRPAAVGTIFTYRVSGSPRVLQHEVHSLMASPLEATWRGQSMWRTDAPGLTLKRVPDAPAPAETAPARLRQMQAITRGFSLENVHEKSGRNDLRLMPKPLYRYGAADSEAIDGAMFCFAHGTDPEAFLFVECRRRGSERDWEYSFARFSDLALEARYKGRTVWSVPPGQWNRHDGIHAYYIAEQVNADSPDDYRNATKPR
jgi:hypothetical protein